MSKAQPSLFAEEGLPVRPAYDVGAVRNRLNDMLGRMRAAASWPWRASTVALYRDTVWPSLLSKLPDKDEAARFRAEIEAEAARLESV